MSNTTHLQKCREAFATRQYETCIRQALLVLPQGGPPDVLQATMISLQRLGRSEELERFSKKALEATEDHPWYHDLLKLTLGELELDELLSRAETEMQRCQAYYYSGSRLLTLGRRKEAQRSFRLALETETDCVEYELARIEGALPAPKPPPEDLTHGNVEEQIDQSLRECDALMKQGRSEEAVRLANQWVDLTRRQLGEEHPQYARYLRKLADIYLILAHQSTASPIYEQALMIRRALKGQDNSPQAQDLSEFAELFTSLANLVEASPLHDQVTRIFETVLGKDHPEFGRALTHLALHYESTGNFAQALTLFEEAVKYAKREFGAHHPEHAEQLGLLARLHISMKAYEEAEPLLQRALDIARDNYGENDRECVRRIAELADLYREMGKLDLSEPLYKSAIEISDKLDDPHPDTATYLASLAELYAQQGQYVLAEPANCRAIAVARETLGDKHPQYAEYLNRLAAMYLKMGNQAAADYLFNESWIVNRTSLNGADFAIDSEDAN